MTARSVVLSVLLGAHPALASTAELQTLTADFGIRASTVRVALTRMVAAGDLIRSADGYRLSDRLLARQHRQDDALDPRVQPWDGTWITMVVTGVGMDAGQRAALRRALHDNRLRELREGVWMRPANLAVRPTDEAHRGTRLLRSRDDDPVQLAATLWDLPAWLVDGRRLLGQMHRAESIPARFVVAAAIVRHLLTDPVLPPELLPPQWPGLELRRAYHDFAAELVARRAQDASVEAT